MPRIKIDNAKVQLPVRVRPAMKAKLKDYADANDITISAAVEDAVSALLKRRVRRKTA